jgi:hypothetical protein
MRVARNVFVNQERWNRQYRLTRRVENPRGLCKQVIVDQPDAANGLAGDMVAEITVDIQTTYRRFARGGRRIHEEYQSSSGFSGTATRGRARPSASFVLCKPR